MKNLLFGAFAGIFLLTACEQKDKNTETTVSADTMTLGGDTMEVTTPAVFTADQVPDTIKTAFATKYPNAKETNWVRYTAVADDQLETDRNYYYVTFDNNNEDMTVWYDDQWVWVRTQTKIPGDSRLPDAVNKMLNDKYPGYQMEEIDKENDKNMDMYELKFMHKGNKVKMHVLPNGTIYSRKVS